MAEFTLKEFENLNLFSNKNLEKIVGSLINKSANAVLVNMYEDSLVLLDHEEGQFYIADYEFDPNDLTLTIENYEPVELIKEEEDFKEKAFEYFDDEDSDTNFLSESYKNDVMNQEKYINELIHESMSAKDFSEVVNWVSVKRIKDELEEDNLENEKFFKQYKERIKTHPLTEILMFDWENPVTVSLESSEPKKLVNKTAIERAHELWKKESFKGEFEEACKILIEDVEDGSEKLKEVFENFPQVFFLDAGDRKSLFGKAIISSTELKEDIDDLLKGLDLIFEKFDLSEMREEYLSEVEMDKEKDDDDAEEKEKDVAPEVEPDNKQKAIAKLKKIAEKEEDENTKKELDSVIEMLEEGLEEGTRPDVMKKAVAILSL